MLARLAAAGLRRFSSEYLEYAVVVAPWPSDHDPSRSWARTPEAGTDVDHPHPPADGHTSWLDKPENVKKFLTVFYVICGLSLVVELLIHKHTEHDAEKLFGFHGIYGVRRDRGPRRAVEAAPPAGHALGRLL